MTFHDAHQSGRFDATPGQRLAMNRQLAEKCSIALITEYMHQVFSIQDWGDVGSESRLVWDKAKWKLESHGVIHVPTVKWRRGTDLRMSVDVQWGFFRHRVKQVTLLRGGGHLPAHLYDKSQERANLQALHGLEHGFGPLARNHRPDVFTLTFDTNRQLTLKRNQDLINGAVKGLHMRLQVPPAATRRVGHIIDGALSTSHCKVHMLDWMAGYDHRGFVLDTPSG